MKQNPLVAVSMALVLSVAATIAAPKAPSESPIKRIYIIHFSHTAAVTPERMDPRMRPAARGGVPA